MKRTKTLVFAAALLAFGMASAGAVRPLAAQEEECPGRTQPVCEEVTTTTCTKMSICGVRVTWPFGLYLCCGETTTDIDYYYFPTAF